MSNNKSQLIMLNISSKFATNLVIVQSCLRIEIDVKDREENETEKEESLFTKLQSVFPKGKLNKKFINKEREAQIVEGSYLFKVMLEKECWRTIQLSGSHTLLDLHELIQRAFDFDDDHMY